MEDSVGEEERREQGGTLAQVKARPEVEAGGGGGGGGGDEPGEEGGFLSAVASKISEAMSGANGSGGDANATAASSGEETEEKRDGNGGPGIFHKLLSSSHPASSPASGAMETEGVKGEAREQDAAGEQSGILSVMASRIGMAMSGANGNGNHSNEDDAKTSNGNGAVDHSKGEEEEDKGDEADGGILSAMASKIGMAMSGPNGDGNHGGGGSDAKISNGEAEEKEKEGEAKVGGIVEQIISNLPSDDQAPDAEEASLLIAIIDD